MIAKLLIMAALFGGTILVMAVLWRRFYDTSKPRTLSEQAVEALTHALARYGLSASHERRWLDNRVLCLERHASGRRLSVELSDGFFDDHCRVQVFFEPSLQQGISILGEDRFGLVGGLLKLREVRVGRERLDRHFILRAKDEDRLKLLLDDRTVRDALLSLKAQVEEIVLSDAQLFVFLPQIPAADDLVALLAQLDALAQRLESFAAAHGPIAQQDAMDFAKVMTDLNMREELAIEAASGSMPGLLIPKQEPAAPNPAPPPQEEEDADEDAAAVTSASAAAASATSDADASSPKTTSTAWPVLAPADSSSSSP